MKLFVIFLPDVAAHIRRVLFQKVPSKSTVSRSEGRFNILNLSILFLFFKFTNVHQDVFRVQGIFSLGRKMCILKLEEIATSRRLTDYQYGHGVGVSMHIV